MPVLHRVTLHTIEDVWAKPHVSDGHELIHVRQGRARLKLGRLEQLADEYNMNAFYLSRAFSQEFGVSITDVLAGVRMKRKIISHIAILYR